MKFFQSILIATLLAFFFIACNSNVGGSNVEPCKEHFLEEFAMKPYEGEELACKTHIRLYEFEGVFFALKLNHCADFAPFTIYDCSGEEFCFTSIGPCYIQESIDYGIIGIEM